MPLNSESKWPVFFFLQALKTQISDFTVETNGNEVAKGSILDLIVCQRVRASPSPSLQQIMQHLWRNIMQSMRPLPLQMPISIVKKRKYVLSYDVRVYQRPIKVSTLPD